VKTFYYTTNKNIRCSFYRYRRERLYKSTLSTTPFQVIFLISLLNASFQQQWLYKSKHIIQLQFRASKWEWSDCHLMPVTVYVPTSRFNSTWR